MPTNSLDKKKINSDSTADPGDIESRVLNNIRDVVFELDRSGKLRYLNCAWTSLTGRKPAATLGKPLGHYLHPDDSDSFNGMLNALRDGHIHHASRELRLLHKNKHHLWVALALDATPCHENTIAIFGHIIDISKRRFEDAPLTYATAHDAVTGVHNRHYFELDLQRRIDLLAHRNGCHSLLHLELTNFKLISQALSHRDGDIALKQIAALLSSWLRDGDLLCRIGGYEFALLLSHCDGNSAIVSAKQLLKQLLNYRYDSQSFSFIVGGNIGIRLIENSGASALQCIAEATRATAISKTLGRNRSYMFIDGEDNQPIAHHVDWNHRIRRAIDNNHLELYLQPIRHISDRRINHYEALLRLVVPETGEVIAPETFIHAIERSGAIHDIDRWVIQHAITLLGTHPDIGRLAINLSAHAFEDPDLLPLIQSQLRQCQVAPQRIILELTETSSLINLDETHTIIASIRAIGCQFALDDFGTGYCSFSYLKHLPADYVKLDGSYIKNICNSETDRAMVRSMNDIAHVLGHKTIAECVESHQAIELLSSIGVDYIQGYSIGKPAPVSHFH